MEVTAPWISRLLVFSVMGGVVAEFVGVAQPGRSNGDGTCPLGEAAWPASA